MQRVAEWDSGNRLSYATCAANPSQISPWPSFSGAALPEVAETIAALATLLEIANYNVEVTSSKQITYCIMFCVLTLPSRASNTSVLEREFIPSNCKPTNVLNFTRVRKITGIAEKF